MLVHRTDSPVYPIVPPGSEREGSEVSQNKDCESCKMAPFNTTPRNTDNHHHKASERRVSTDPNTCDVEDHAPEVVKVAVRLRPLSEHENSWSAVECLRVDPAAQQVIIPHPLSLSPSPCPSTPPINPA